MNEDFFSKIVKLVISTNEGGYFHPDMLKDGRLKDPKGLMSAGPGRVASGETMYGLDRVNGASLYKNDQGRKFWKLIDDANARSKWKWNSMGGDLADQLQALAGDIMFPEYLKLSAKYLTPEAQAIVNEDPVLLYHFIYAVWNGAGWFKKFATIFNASVAGGETNILKLRKIAIESRTENKNSLIAQGGKKIKGMQAQIIAAVGGVDSASARSDAREGQGMGLFGIIMIVAGVIFLLFLIF